MAEETLKIVGRGHITLDLSAQGELRVVNSIQDVISLWKEGAEGKIAIVEDAGITTLGPVLSKLVGVVCKTGGIGSHLAIVTREFSIPALMGTRMETDENLNGQKAIIQPDANKNGLLILCDR